MLSDFKEDTEFIIAKLLTEGKVVTDEIDELCIIDCGGSHYGCNDDEDYVQEDIDDDELDEDYLDDEDERDYEPNKTYTQVGGKINWDAMLNCFGRKNWKYDSGFGLETFMGWITFKNSNTWLERKEYDGSEWWESVTKPNLHENNLR